MILRLVFLTIPRVFIIAVLVAIPFIFAGSAIAQSQNTTPPTMVINMSDHSIKVGNATSNETLTFTNNSGSSSGNSTVSP